jgi:predicted MFS family arabinose efflux permease
MQSASVKLRRKIRWSTTAFFFLSGIVSATWSSRIPEIQDKFHLSNTAWGGVLFAIPVGMVTGLPVSSYIIERFSSAKIMTVAGVVFALTLSSLGITPNVLLLVICLYCFGLSRSLFTMAINTNAIEVQRLYPQPIIASFHGVWSLACFCAAAIGTFMIAHDIGPAYHFVIFSLAVAALIILSKRQGNSKKNNGAEKKPFFIKPDKYLFTLGLVCFCVMICEGSVFDWSVNYYEKVVNVNRNMVTAGYTAFIIAMTSGRLVGDKITGSLGLTKVILINGFLMAAGFAIAVAFPYLWPAAVGFLLIGLGDSIMIPIVYSLAGLSTKMKPSYAIASVTMMGYVGFLLGPLMMGSLSGAFGMRMAFTVLAVLSLCISILAIVLIKQTRE